VQFSFAQESISYWQELTPDSIFISKNIDTIIGGFFYVEYGLQKQACKQFGVYSLNDNMFIPSLCFEIHQVGLNLQDSIKIPHKFDSNYIVAILQKSDLINMHYKVKYKWKKNKTSVFNQHEYNYEIIQNQKIIYSGHSSINSTEKKKNLKPIYIYIYKTNDFDMMCLQIYSSFRSIDHEMMFTRDLIFFKFNTIQTK
jgi:hypothetical protein